MRIKHDHQPKLGSVLGKNRLEAFSDGVFAVAITLLVLNLQSPSLIQTIGKGNLVQGFMEFLPKFLAFVLSFIIVGIYWVAHHNTFHYIKHSDRTLLWLNIFLLMCIVFIPVPTALLGQHPEQQLSIVVYSSTLIVTGIILQVLWWYATHHNRLVDKDINSHLVATAARRNLTAPVIYLFAIVISCVNIQASLIILALVPIFYIFPGQVDHYWAEIQEEYERHRIREINDESHVAHLAKLDPDRQPKAHDRKPISGKVFYQQQITALETHDIDRLLTQYHPDATIVGFDFIVKGHTEIREHFTRYLDHLGPLTLKNTEKFAETEDAIFFEATITSGQSEAKVYNVFLLWGGKATHHFTGSISHRE